MPSGPLPPELFPQERENFVLRFPLLANVADGHHLRPDIQITQGQKIPPLLPDRGSGSHLHSLLAEDGRLC